MRSLIESLNQNGLAYALLIALSAYLGRVWAARIARGEDKAIKADIARLEAQLAQAQEKLRGKIDTTVHIHKAQFEKEFAVYQQLMKDVNRTRTAFHTLHPVLKKVFESEEQKHEYCKPFRDEFAAAFASVRSTVEDNKPFYPQDVFKPCDAFIELCVDEIASLHCGPGEGIHDWKEQEKMKKRFDELINEITESIRHRLESVTVIE